jgi:hypothetical protein
MGLGARDAFARRVGAFWLHARPFLDHYDGIRIGV